MPGPPWPRPEELELTTVPTPTPHGVQPVGARGVLTVALLLLCAAPAVRRARGEPMVRGSGQGGGVEG